MGGGQQELSIADKIAALRKTSIVLGSAPWELKKRENRRMDWNHAGRPRNAEYTAKPVKNEPKLAGYTTAKVESEMKARFQVAGFKQPPAF
mmetsp:Transcript_18025/g.45091  ORF Transcript_18025/g.45091 Transcript_18025/m.45091 type:complete len:91 (-) Transcript_18025:506-778(-)|eukprot:CAMPEP_0178981982 /NCGR_PEP_ID=MMETSP0795-20121207/246_1 /TAXON_ID=88552 /ORGANISM="Amoebophrya sp., Strain Ameob2" /LENGTH=90 /DNA_ID=CAMNT_0020672583 /DNA_START=146 /DNA_END=418 /DNA_ORIENTATION=+